MMTTDLAIVSPTVTAKRKRKLSKIESPKPYLVLTGARQVLIPRTAGEEGAPRRCRVEALLRRVTLRDDWALQRWPRVERFPAPVAAAGMGGVLAAMRRVPASCAPVEPSPTRRRTPTTPLSPCVRSRIAVRPP